MVSFKKLLLRKDADIHKSYKYAVVSMQKIDYPTRFVWVLMLHSFP